MRFLIYAIFLLQISIETSNAEDRFINTDKSISTSKHLKNNKHIRIAAAKLESLVKENNEGIYQKIFQLAASEIDYEVTEIFVPFRRALLEFEYKKTDCTYSFTEVLESKLGKQNIISSYPLGAFSFYMFTNQNAVAITNMNDLESLKVGGINGQEQYYKKLIPKGLKVHLVQSDRQGLDMLELKRLDVFIAALPDINPYLDLVSFDKRFPIYESFDRITCHNTAKNRGFLNALSHQLEILKQNGSYKKIAGKLYIDF
jgi:ABC-type amino acid transport substrate-binding protein